MGNSLRCCLACVLPCGALDLIRIVHLNGHVKEITRAVTAGEILQSYPNHVLSKPSSQGVLILSPDTDLKRGTIYFLIPHSSLPSDHHHLSNSNAPISSKTQKLHLKPKDLSTLDQQNHGKLCEAKSKSKSGVRHQRRRTSRGSSGVWHPHLHSITED